MSLTRQQRQSRLFDYPLGVRQEWRTVYRYIRMHQRNFVPERIKRLIVPASVCNANKQQIDKPTLIARLAKFKELDYCKDCDSIPDESCCGNCGSCSGCCECLYCHSCEDNHDQHDMCGTCDDCRGCCECNVCQGCDRRYAQDTWMSFCSNCEYCEHCCECSYCSRCETSVHSDYFCGNCDECTDCCDCASCSSVIKDYSTDALRFLSFRHIGSKPKDNTYYGVELEVESRSNRDGAAERVASLLDGHAILKHDGSLDDDTGFEIVTAPATLEAHREYFKPFFASNPARYLSSWENGNCGIHVHISRPSALVIGKMLVFLNNADNQKFISSVAGRGSNRWASVDTAKKVTDWDKPNSRYEALNLTNSQTIELRIFRGTLKETSFWKCLEFAHALLNFARSHSIKDMTVSRFLQYITQQSNRKQYRNLIDFLVAKDYLSERFKTRQDQRVLPTMSSSVAAINPNPSDVSDNNTAEV